VYSTSLVENSSDYSQKETIELLCFPDPKLREKSKDILFDEESPEEIKKLADDMAFVMSELGGIGLAAPQIDVHKKMIVVDVQDEEGSLHCFINPRIISREGKVTTKERCLSVPEMEIPVTRSKKIRLQFKDMSGKSHVRHFKDLMSICIQHELDHLDGKIIIDYIAS
jgi:peptide deformylase